MATFEGRLKFKPRNGLGPGGEWLVSKAVEIHQQFESDCGNAFTNGKLAAFIEVLERLFPLQESENGYSEEHGWNQQLGWRRNIELIQAEESMAKKRPRRF